MLSHCILTVEGLLMCNILWKGMMYMLIQAVVRLMLLWTLLESLDRMLNCLSMTISMVVGDVSASLHLSSAGRFTKNLRLATDAESLATELRNVV